MMQNNSLIDKPPFPQSILVVTNFGGIMGGGADRVLLNILNELPASTRVYLVGADKTEQLLETLPGKDNISAINVGYHAYLYTTLEWQQNAPTGSALRHYLDDFFEANFRALNLLIERLQGVKIDVVHSNTSVVVLGALYAKYHGLKHLWHAYEFLIHDDEAQRFWVWLMNELSDRIVAASQATAIAYGPKSQTIYAGFNPTDFLETLARLDPTLVEHQFHIRPEETVILCLGVISERKGQLELLQAIRHLKLGLTTDESPQVRIVLAGYSPDPIYSQTIEQLISEAGLSGQVILTGLLAYHDALALLKRANLVVQPSPLPDPYPTVIIEAMLAGKPIIAGRNGGIPEMIEDGQTGLLCEPDQPADLADKISWVLDHPVQAARLGQNAAQIAPEKYDVKHTMTALTQLYAQTLSGSTPPPSHQTYWQSLLITQVQRREAELLVVKQTLQAREQELASVKATLHTTQTVLNVTQGALQDREHDLNVIRGSRTWYMAKKMQQAYQLIKQPFGKLIRG